MKNYKIVMPAAAIIALLGSTSAFAQQAETRSLSASVSGALQGDTGFLTGGQVQVQGVGQGAMSLGRTVANINVVSGATGGLTPIGAEGTTTNRVPTSSAQMITTFDFNRTVDTSAALVGVGNVVAQGESLGGVGVVGTASANASRSGTINDNDTLRSGSASTPTTAQGSLVGQFSTTNTMQLQGQGSLFAAAQALDIGERNAGIAAGRTGIVSAAAETVDLAGMTPDFAGSVPTVGSSNGAAFGSFTDLKDDKIDINVANAGQGSVLASGSTGGFFGQGTTFGATVAPTFAQTNGFFNVQP